MRSRSRRSEMWAILHGDISAYLSWNILTSCSFRGDVLSSIFVKAKCILIQLKIFLTQIRIILIWFQNDVRNDVVMIEISQYALERSFHARAQVKTNRNQWISKWEFATVKITGFSFAIFIWAFCRKVIYCEMLCGQQASAIYRDEWMSNRVTLILFWPQIASVNKTLVVCDHVLWVVICVGGRRVCSERN